MYQLHRYVEWSQIRTSVNSLLSPDADNLNKENIAVSIKNKARQEICLEKCNVGNKLLFPDRSTYYAFSKDKC